MLPTELKVGWVFSCSYLWHWGYVVEGRQEGDKDRSALVLAIVGHLDDGTPAVRVLLRCEKPVASTELHRVLVSTIDKANL